jgi:hypothetical protein
MVKIIAVVWDRSDRVSFMGVSPGRSSGAVNFRELEGAIANRPME